MEKVIKDEVISVYVSKEDKEKFIEVAEALGLSSYEDAIRIFVKMFNSYQGFPFTVEVPHFAVLGSDVDFTKVG